MSTHLISLFRSNTHFLLTLVAASLLGFVLLKCLRNPFSDPTGEANFSSSNGSGDLLLLETCSLCRVIN